MSSKFDEKYRINETEVKFVLKLGISRKVCHKSVWNFWVAPDIKGAILDDI